MKTITRIININYKELVKTLTNLDVEDPQRCHGELDLLKDNINKHLIQYIKGGFLIVQLDDVTGKAYICGEPILEDMYDLPRIGCRTERSSSEKIWFQIQHSLEEAKLYNAYEKIFGSQGDNDNEKNKNRKSQLRCEQRNGYYTYSDEKGNIIITIQCIAAWDFSEGLALVRKYNPDENIMGHGFIDTGGNFVIPLIWSDARSFSEGMAAVANNKEDFGYIDKSGRLVIPCQYSKAGYFCDNLAPVWDNYNCQGGYIDKTGRIVITQKDEWGKISEFRDGLAPVRHNNGKWGYIDKSGKVVIPFLYEKVGCFCEGYAPVWDSTGNCGYIDGTGEIVIPFNDKWKNASWFREGLAPVQNKDNLWGYIDKTGRLVIPFQWFEADQFENGEAWVKPSGHYRLINPKGEYVMSCMEEKSILSQQEFNDYLNNLAQAVCINGEALEKYKKIVSKRYGEEVYNNMRVFVEEVYECAKRKNFTNTCKVNLGNLGKNAAISEEVINLIIQHYENLVTNNPPNSYKRFLYVFIVLLIVGLIYFIIANQSNRGNYPQKTIETVDPLMNEKEAINTDSHHKSESAEDLYLKAVNDTLNEAEDLIRAAEMGYAPAQTVLGIRYYKGEGFDADESEALRWFHKASEQGDSEARDYISYINGYNIIDGIKFKDIEPSKEFISNWIDEYHDICVENIKGNCESYSNVDEMAEKDPCLVFLLINSKSIVGDQRQEWFNLYNLMGEEQIYKLYNILYREQSTLARINMNYDLTQRRINRKREILEKSAEDYMK